MKRKTENRHGLLFWKKGRQDKDKDEEKKSEEGTIIFWNLQLTYGRLIYGLNSQVLHEDQDGTCCFTAWLAKI